MFVIPTLIPVLEAPLTAIDFKKSPDDFEDEFRKAIPRYSKENFPKVLAIVDAVKKIGEKHGVTSGQVTLAWLLAQGDDVFPIPGTTRVKVRSVPDTLSL